VTDDVETQETVVQKSLKAKPRTQRDVARWARRKKLLDKVRDADIEALLALVRAFRGDDAKTGEWDDLTDEVVDQMSSDSTYEKVEMLCLEVLELRKRLRRLGWDNNWQPVESQDSGSGDSS
jgi:hypothetical protein